MTFSYDATLSNDVSQVRFRVGDTVENDGALPNGVNLSDEEITAIIGFEGSWQRAVASSFESLGAAWAKKASFSASGVSHSQSFQMNNVASEYRKQAAMWRKRYGHIGDDQDPEAADTTPSLEWGWLDGGFQSSEVTTI